MSRIVNCVVLKREAEGLDHIPHPGSLGERIYENVSAEGWKQWLERLTMIINENGLNTADTGSVNLIEQRLREVPEPSALGVALVLLAALSRRR